MDYELEKAYVEKNVFSHAIVLNSVFEHPNSDILEDLGIDEDFSNVENLCYNEKDVEDGECDEDQIGEMKYLECWNWFEVSEFFYRVLKKENEIVLEINGHYFWNRQTFGQAIYLDHVVTVACKPKKD